MWLLYESQSVWADVIKNKYKRVIIFEDDIMLFDNFKENLVNFLKHIPNDSDVAFLDIGMNRPFAEKTYFVSAGFWLSGFLNTPSKYIAKLKRSPRIWGIHAYSITYENAKKLLRYTKISSIPIDNQIIIGDCRNHNLYVSKIKLVSANMLESEIKKLNKTQKNCK